MRRFICILLFVLIFTPAFALKPNDEIVRLSLEGQRLIFERRYDDALIHFKKVQKDYPDSVLGTFGEAAVYEIQMLEREDFHLEEEFLDAAKRGEAIIRNVMQNYNPSDEELFFCAAMYGLEGFFKARKNQWWGAYMKGTLARQVFGSIKKHNPDFIDADFGQGMYLYWRSVFIKELSLAPFFTDKRREGMEIVEHVAGGGRLAREMARVNLGVIYFEEKRFEDSIRVFEEYSRLYPTNVIIHQMLGRVLLADKKYDRSIGEFKKIIAIDPKIAKAHYFIGMAMTLEGKKEKMGEAEKYLNNYLKMEPERLWVSYALYWLGMLAEKQGDKEKAQGYYTQAVKLNRGLKSAELRLRGLGGGL